MLAKALLVIAVALFLVALPLAVVIMIRRRTANFHKIWDFAVEGDTQSRVYMVLVVVAFACAVTGTLLAAADEPSRQRRVAHSSNLSSQPTAFGDG